jgi:putative phosphoribosyl transferase
MGSSTHPTACAGPCSSRVAAAAAATAPRYVHVAEVLHRSGLATLLFDLLAEHEAADRRHVFDVPVLARRLRCAAEAIRTMAPMS